MRECGICYETKHQRILPCGHGVCHTCYDCLQSDTCPFCRHPFREPSNSFLEDDTNDPEYWRDYGPGDWTVMSRYLRSGTEIIRVFRNGQVPTSWRNDAMTTVVRRRRLRRRRARRN